MTAEQYRRPTSKLTNISFQPQFLMPQDVDLLRSYTIPAPPKFPDAISQNLATAITPPIRPP